MRSILKLFSVVLFGVVSPIFTTYARAFDVPSGVLMFPAPDFSAVERARARLVMVRDPANLIGKCETWVIRAMLTVVV